MCKQAGKLSLSQHSLDVGLRPQVGLQVQKEKKVKGRVKKKQMGTAQKHKAVQAAVSGQRTGKSKRKQERLRRLVLRETEAQELKDQHMSDAPKPATGVLAKQKPGAHAMETE